VTPANIENLPFGIHWLGQEKLLPSILWFRGQHHQLDYPAAGENRIRIVTCEVYGWAGSKSVMVMPFKNAGAAPHVHWIALAASKKVAGE